MIFLHMALVIKLSFLLTGGLFISPSCGGSVASANAPRVSMIRLTHSNCTTVRGPDPESYREDADDNWGYCRNEKATSINQLT